MFSCGVLLIITQQSLRHRLVAETSRNHSNQSNNMSAPAPAFFWGYLANLVIFLFLYSRCKHYKAVSHWFDLTARGGATVGGERATLDWRSSNPVSNNSARLSGFGVSLPHLSVELCLSGLCPFTVSAISIGEPVLLSLEPLLKSEVLASSLQEQGNSVRDHNIRPTQIFWHCNRSLGCPAVHTAPFTAWSWQLKVQPREFWCISKTNGVSIACLIIQLRALSQDHRPILT